MAPVVDAVHDKKFTYRQYRDIIHIIETPLTVIVCKYCWRLEKDIIKAKSMASVNDRLITSPSQTE